MRGLKLPLTISVGELARNRHYQKVHFPKRVSDDTDSHAMARFAVVEQPPATPARSSVMVELHEGASRLQAQVAQTTQAINRLHNMMARVFPELALLWNDLSAASVLCLIQRYPTPERIAAARRSSLERIPYLPHKRTDELQEAARQSVGAFPRPSG